MLVKEAIARDRVIIEVGTGTWCPYCPGAAMGVDEMHAEGLSGFGWYSRALILIDQREVTGIIFQYLNFHTRFLTRRKSILAEIRDQLIRNESQRYGSIDIEMDLLRHHLNR